MQFFKTAIEKTRKTLTMMEAQLGSQEASKAKVLSKIPLRVLKINHLVHIMKPFSVAEA